MIKLPALRSTMGLCLGLRPGLSSAIVVVSVKRTDAARVHYVTHEWEEKILNVDNIAAALEVAQKAFHPVLTVGYYGGRDDEEIFKTLSIRLGRHVKPAPHDETAPMSLLIDDFRSGRLKAKGDSLVVRDTKTALWRNDTPDETGVLAALRCAHWAAQQYRAPRLKPKPTQEERDTMVASTRRRRLENPF